MIERPPFPENFDSTLLASFRSCPTKFYREYVLHYKPATPSVHLHAGGAFAKGLEIARRAYYEEEQDAGESVARGMAALLKAYGDFECPHDSAKSLERMAGAYEFYFDRYPLTTDAATPLQLPDGRAAIEFSFAEPLEVMHPETGNPLIYCGRSDMIASYCDGQYIFDDKTASSLGASWSKQWEMRSQFTGYTWAAQRAGLSINGVLVRGISILKTKYDTQQAVCNRAPFEIDRWYEQTHRDLTRAIRMWQEGYWDYNLDHSCAEYGGCMFQTACKSPDPQPWLDLYFQKRVWDPLAREERDV